MWKNVPVTAFWENLSFQIFIILILRKNLNWQRYLNRIWIHGPIINQLSFHQNKHIDITKDLVIFDEIQAIPRALTSLKYFQEDMPELALCCAGSLLGVKLNHESYPVGKVQTDYLYPLTFVEFLRAIDEDFSADLIETCNYDTVIPQLVHDRIWERLKWYFIVGGLPEVVQTFIDNKE